MPERTNNEECPVCGQPAVTRCRCFWGDSHCKNGHQWHYCPKHNAPVAGGSVHSKQWHHELCTCLDKEDNGKRPLMDSKLIRGGGIV